MVKKSYYGFIEWLITLSLMVVCAGTIGVYSFFCFFQNPAVVLQCRFLSSVLVAGLFGVLCIIILSLVTKNEPVRRRFRIYRRWATFCMACFAIFIMTDATLPSHDFTERDVIPDTKDAYESFNTLKPLTLDTDKNIGIDRTKWQSKAFFENIGEYHDQILAAWDAIAEERAIIEHLSDLEIVVDMDPNEKIKLDFLMIRFSTITDLQAIYVAYAALSIKNGKPDQGLRSLNQLYTAARKGLLQTSTLIHKMLWEFGVIARTINAVFFMSTCDYMDTDTLQSLTEILTPLTYDEADMERTLIGEYLFGKNMTLDDMDSYLFLDFFSDSLWPPPESSLARHLISKAVYYVSFRKNRFVLERKKFFEILINCSKESPPNFLPADTYNDSQLKKPTLRNLGGWILVSHFTIDFKQYVVRVLNGKAKSDLLAIYLSEKAGKQLVLNDVFTGRPYQLKTTGTEIRSPGFDGEFDTDDDIVLGK